MNNPINKSITVPKVIFKPFKMPKGLIYDAPKNDHFYLINTANGELVGKMRAEVEKDYDHMYERGRKTKTFYISELKIGSDFQRQGWGSYLINFAKNKSLELESEGRVSLFAFNPEYPPHLFYKKLGFISKSNKRNRIMDECIRNGKPAPNWYGLRMYLPLDNIKKTNEIEKNKNFIGKFINFCMKNLKIL